MSIWSLLHSLLKNHRIKIIGVLLLLDILICPIIHNDIFLITYIIHYSIYFLVGNTLNDIKSFRGFIQTNKSFAISACLFVTLCCIFCK